MLSSSWRNEMGKQGISYGLDSVLADLVTRGSKNPLWTGFAYRLSSVRCAAHLTADAVNKYARLSNNVVNRLEDGHNLPKIETAERIAVGLGISPSWLAFGPEGNKPFRKKRPRRLLPYEDPVALPGLYVCSERYRGCGQRLRQVRERKGFTLREVARLAEERTRVTWVVRDADDDRFRISHQAIMLTESGATVPRIDTIEALAKALDVSPGWLAFGDDDEY